MRGKTRTSVAREELPLPYAALREGDRVAACTFVELAVRELRAWLDRHFRHHRLQLDTLEIAVDAIVEVFIRADSISSWPEAWDYAVKVARRMALGREKRWKRERSSDSVENEDNEDIDMVDPSSAGLEARIGLVEGVQTALNALPPRARAFALALSECAGDLGELADALDVNIRTVRRWRRALREKFARALRDAGWSSADLSRFFEFF